MLAITVDLLHGTIRAGSPDDTALAGLEPRPEWPPSPARLFSALVAADGTRDRCSVTTGAELTWLEQLSPPLIYASSAGKVLASALEPRFVVAPGTANGSVQEYPVRQNRRVHPGVRQAPFDDAITYVWPDADPAAHLPALRARAARVGYLGCADSPVRVRVADHVATRLGDPWRPDRGATLTLPIPYGGFLDNLDAAYDRFSAGEPTRRAWIPSVRSGYRPPGESRPEAKPAPQVIWLRFDRPVAGRKLLAVTETLRDAVLDHVQRLLPPGGEVPVVLHGHRPNGENGPQARFLAFPDVGHEHADGRLLGAAVWLPAGTEPETVQVVRSAVARLGSERLAKPGWFDVGVTVHTGERRPWATNPRRWSGPAHQWVTATPTIHERWTKRTPDLREVARWCAHADLPAPTAVRVTRHPCLIGALDLHPAQVTRAGRDHRPHSHIELEFADAVTGPVVLGRGRQFGLGLMAPLLPEVLGEGDRNG